MELRGMGWGSSGGGNGGWGTATIGHIQRMVTIFTKQDLIQITIMKYVVKTKLRRRESVWESVGESVRETMRFQIHQNKP